jgi:hypothetical protein
MLILHIVLASLLIISTVVLLFAGITRNKATWVRTAAQGGLLSTFLSGGMLVLTYGGLGKFCVTMSAMTLAVLAVDRFYLYRLQPARVTLHIDE